jgi:hypothetical protein
MKTPKMAGLATVTVAFVASLFVMTLASCSVTPSGPVSAGAAHGALGSDNMCDYYYKKSAGWTYAFNNVENIYNADGSITTLTGAPDTVRTLGFYAVAPNGDSLYRLAITYRIATSYAGRGELTMNFVTNNGGAWVEPGYSVPNMQTPPAYKKPRPVSTDTILAGMVGRIRTMCDDFSNSSSYAWQSDTIWASERNDSVFVWERVMPSGTIKQSRCVFSRDFVNNTKSNGTGANVNWTYDLIWGTTAVDVEDANTSVTVPAGSYPMTARFRVHATDFTYPETEQKWYSFGVGVTRQYDVWNVTTDGVHFTKQDFTRSLVSLTKIN